MKKIEVVEPVRIFCGYDSREAVGFHVWAHSVISRASVPVQIIPLDHRVLGASDRGDSSTAFNYARFLVPWLARSGHAIWMDGADMLCLDDVAKLWEMRDYQSAVKVVRIPEYEATQPKFLGQANPSHPRKNWSSVMLYWVDHQACRNLTPARVASMTGADLHRFSWCAEKWLGTLPAEWNVLAGESVPKPAAPSLIHYTLGIPAFAGYSGCEYAEDWWREYRAMQAPIAEQPAAMDAPPSDLPAVLKRPRGRPRKVA